MKEVKNIRLILLVIGIPFFSFFSKAQEVMMLKEDIQVKPDLPVEVDFELKEFFGKQVRLRMDARIEWDSEIGNTQAMAISINKQALVGANLMNKQLRFTMREGVTLDWASINRNSYRLMYAPDFEESYVRLRTDENNQYGLPDPKQDPFHFMWDITSYITPGTNKITIVQPGMAFSLRLRNIAVEIGDPVSYHQKLEEETAKQTTPAPTGLLEVYTPQKTPGMPTIHVSPEGGIRFVVSDGSEFKLRSRTSLPEGKWSDDATKSKKKSWRRLNEGKPFTAGWTGHNYKVERVITLHPDSIHVSDTVSNTGDELTGVVFENRLILPEEPEKVFFGGRELEWTSETGDPRHPTIMARLECGAVGLVAEDDIFRVHSRVFREKNIVGLANRSLGIAPGNSHTIEWSLYIIPDGSYWDFINAIRRDWGANFTLEGPMDFPAREWGVRWDEGRLTADAVKKWLEKNHNSLAWVMTHVGHDPTVAPRNHTPDNLYFYHGTAIPYAEIWGNNTRSMVELMQEAAPSVKVFAYIHLNLSTEKGYETKYRDSVALDRSGNPAKSAYGSNPGLFIPTLNNLYGEALEKVYKYLVEDIGANIYIDEIAVGIPIRAPYTEWDGCTVDIDPATHAVRGKESMSVLLMQPWLEKKMEYLKSKGKTAFANTTPPTRTMRKWQIQHFTEDFGASGVISTHLSTPLAQTYKKGAAGFQHLMETLDYGGLQFTRTGDWSDHLFPTTPIELRPGIIIAEERILTNRSGKFGWGDTSRADVYMFDGQGDPVENPDVKEVKEDNQVFTEIRMPGDHLAILVRRK